MRAVIQRVLEAQVTVGGESVDRVGRGLLVYLSVSKADTTDDVQFMADKLINLRVFADQAGKVNISVLDIGGQILLISNFTLHGDCRKGRRPGFEGAAEPELARQLYEQLAEQVAAKGITIKKGIFGEHMEVSSVNDGPVTFLLDSSRLF